MFKIRETKYLKEFKKSFVPLRSLLFSLFLSFIKKGQSRPLFVWFRPLLVTISIIQVEKSIDGVIGIWNWGRRMVDADETTELWQLLYSFLFIQYRLTHFSLAYVCYTVAILLEF